MVDFVQGAFRGGFGAGLAQADPVGRFFSPLERALERRQQSQQFQSQQAEQRRQFDETLGLKREELGLTLQKERADAAFKLVGPTVENMQTLAKTEGQASSTGQQLPPSFVQLREQTIATTAGVLQRAGFPDPEGEARRLYETAQAGEAVLSPDEFTQRQDGIIEFIQKAQARGDPKESTAAMLTVLTTGSPQLQKFAMTALENAATQQELAVREGQAEVAGARARLEGAQATPGVSPEAAEAFGFGRGGTTVNVDTGPQGDLTKTNITELQQVFLQSEDAITAIDNLSPLLTEDTVGLLGKWTQVAGGFAQNIPGIRQLADALPGLRLDEASVNEARRAQSAILATIAQIAPVLNAQAAAGRISNQQLERTMAALEAPETWTTLGSVQAVMSDIRNLAVASRDRTRSILTTGSVFGGAPATSPTTFAAEGDIPEGARVRDRVTGEVLEKRGGQMVPVDLNEAE